MKRIRKVLLGRPMRSPQLGGRGCKEDDGNQKEDVSPFKKKRILKIQGTRKLHTANHSLSFRIWFWEVFSYTWQWTLWGFPLVAGLFSLLNFKFQLFSTPEKRLFHLGKMQNSQLWWRKNELQSQLQISLKHCARGNSKRTTDSFQPASQDEHLMWWLSGQGNHFSLESCWF